MTTYGYARVSTPEQQASLDTQRQALIDRGVQPRHIYADICSGAKKRRPEFDALQRAADAGDTILCSKIDRLGRTMVETMETILELVQRGVIVETGDMGRLDPESATGEMAINVMLTFAQFERRRLIERTNEGIAHARASGKKLGRPSKVTPNLAAAIRAAYESNLNISQIARLHGLSRDVVRRVIRESEQAVSPDCDSSQTLGGSMPSRADALRE